MKSLLTFLLLVTSASATKLSGSHYGFQKHTRNAAGGFLAQVPYNEGLVTQIMASLDTNGDSMISEDEFIALLKSIFDAQKMKFTKEFEDEAKEEFKSLDTTGDGLMNKTELRNAIY